MCAAGRLTCSNHAHKHPPRGRRRLAEQDWHQHLWASKAVEGGRAHEVPGEWGEKVGRGILWDSGGGSGGGGDGDDRRSYKLTAAGAGGAEQSKAACPSADEAAEEAMALDWLLPAVAGLQMFAATL